MNNNGSDSPDIDRFALHQHTSQSLAKVMAQVAQGNREAFAELYQATCRKLFGIVVRILKRRELAEEVLQEIYLKIWDKAADFDTDRASPISWMATIARNRALDEVRKRQLSLVDDADAMEEAVDESSSPSGKIEQSQAQQQIDRCLETLGEPRSSMIRLAYLDCFSRQQLAERFTQPVGTIKTWLHRSLKQLKDCLGT
jgi:RNA polymerase sigma-70 factor (ECF subfamily)